ncbi:MAG: hypothetical protein JHC93_07415 [Parachlamydiales bacterium]|nr:hypothetical protein [Parachlamydiales bacterium]
MSNIYQSVPFYPSYSYPQALFQFPAIVQKISRSKRVMSKFHKSHPSFQDPSMNNISKSKILFYGTASTLTLIGCYGCLRSLKLTTELFKQRDTTQNNSSTYYPNRTNRYRGE